VARIHASLTSTCAIAGDAAASSIDNIHH